MNDEGQDFDKLRRALALKRHETPPPRYFNELPGRILARLGEPEPRPGLWTRLGQLFGDRPMFATGAGVAAGCAVLLGVGLLMLQEAAPTATTAGVPAAADTTRAIAQNPGPSAPGSLAHSNANVGDDLFQQFQPSTVPVSLKSQDR